MSGQLGTVTPLPVHPASPVLLTKNGPLGALGFEERDRTRIASLLTDLEFENRRRAFCPADL